MASGESQRQLPAGQYCGISLHRREVAGLTLLESDYPPHRRTPNHSHQEASFCLVLQGRFRHACRFDSIVCAPMTLLFYTPDEAHSEEFGQSGSRCFIVGLHPSWLARLAELSRELPSPAAFGGEPVCGLALRLHQEFRLNDEVSSLAIEGLMLEVLAEAARRPRPFLKGKLSPPLDRVKDLLHARFPEPLTLSSVAETAGLHPVCLAQMFRRQFHCSVGEYVRKLRIEFACREIARDRSTLAEIAATAGFYDQSHFTRVFRRQVGLTPSSFRRMARPARPVPLLSSVLDNRNRRS